MAVEEAKARTDYSFAVKCIRKTSERGVQLDPMIVFWRMRVSSFRLRGCKAIYDNCIVSIGVRQLVGTAQNGG